MRGAIGRPVLYNPQPQRELISVPVTDQSQNYPTGYKRNRQPAETNNYTPNAEVKHTDLLNSSCQNISQSQVPFFSPH